MTSETTPRRRRVHVKPKVLSARDVAILDSLNTARYLTAEAVTWLHVPGWRTRWDRGQRYAGSHVYERLAFLLEQGWVYRIKRSMQMGTDRFRMDPDVYRLTEEGARVLADRQQRSLDTIFYDRLRARSIYTLNHGVEIGTFYAALRAKVEATPGLRLTDWEGEHLLAKAYDRVSVRRVGRRGDMETVTLPVQPDATAVLHHAEGLERLFIEIDRGTRPIPTWVDKAAAYSAYHKSAELKARYGCTTFWLLTITPDTTRQQAVMRAVAQALGKPDGRYLFGLQDAVHPTMIGAAWQILASVTPATRSGWPQITTAPHVFIV